MFRRWVMKRAWMGALFVGAALAVAMNGGCGAPNDEGSSGTGANGTGGSALGGAGGATTSTGAGGAGCASDCDDGVSCTVDTCVGGGCLHTVGPNSGATACPPGTYCEPTEGCIAAPACATTQDCLDAWAGDACKAEIACDPVTSLCTFELLDKDGDGHSPPVCGGDDCDDDDGKNYPGHQESCDGEDNNCDGLVDDVCLTMQSSPGTCCGFECVDLQTDSENCGACGGHCPSPTTQHCAGGDCVCNAGFTPCPGTDCVNLQTDQLHCGACGATCSGGTCTGGDCVCPGSLTECAGACVDTDADPAHCGGCAQPCSADASCVGGSCVCSPGFADCGSGCTDLASDSLNCAACGNACPAGTECFQGHCGIPWGEACTWNVGYSCGGPDPDYLYFCAAPGCGVGTCSGSHKDTVPPCGGNPDPVCGCNGMTYWDADALNMMSMAHPGPCAAPTVCGGPSQILCPFGQVCWARVADEASCGGSPEGICIVPGCSFGYAHGCDNPSVCTDIWELVGAPGQPYFEAPCL